MRKNVKMALKKVILTLGSIDCSSRDSKNEPIMKINIFEPISVNLSEKMSKWREKKSF